MSTEAAVLALESLQAALERRCMTDGDLCGEDYAVRLVDIRRAIASLRDEQSAPPADVKARTEINQSAPPAQDSSTSASSQEAVATAAGGAALQMTVDEALHHNMALSYINLQHARSVLAAEVRRLRELPGPYWFREAQNARDERDQAQKRLYQACNRQWRASDDGAHCAALGCSNRSDEGRFVGDFCAPCDSYLRTNGRFGTWHEIAKEPVPQDGRQKVFGYRGAALGYEWAWHLSSLECTHWAYAPSWITEGPKHDNAQSKRDDRIQMHTLDAIVTHEELRKALEGRNESIPPAGAPVEQRLYNEAMEEIERLKQIHKSDGRLIAQLIEERDGR